MLSVCQVQPVRVRRLGSHRWRCRRSRCIGLEAAERLIQRQSWSWAHRQHIHQQRRSNCRGPGAHTIILLESTEFVLVPSTTTPLYANQCPVSPPNLTQSYNNALRVSNAVRLWTALILQDAEGYFREGVPSFGSATRPTLGRASITRFSSPTVRCRWSRERHRKDGGAQPLLSNPTTPCSPYVCGR